MAIFLDDIITSGIVYVNENSISVESYQGYIPSRGGLYYHDDKLYGITSLELPEKRIYHGEMKNSEYLNTVSITSDSDFFLL